MSGWLRRLAAQATGTSNGIRPTRAPVRAASHAPAPFEISEEIVAPNRDDPIDAGEMPSRTQQPEPTTPEPAPSTQAAHAPVLRRSSPLRFDEVLAHLTTPRPPAQENVPDRAQPVITDVPRTPRAVGASLRANQESDSGADDHARKKVPEHSVPRVAALTTDTEATTSKPASPMVAVSSARVRTQPSTARDMHRPAAEQSHTAFAPIPPPDVHIHIGRIEVSAVMPPAAQRRESAAAKPALSLDEYLQRRRKRS